MATTTNYSWTTPDDTALVKDGAAAIRTLGSSIDTTTKNLNPSTTLGDIEYRSSTANTNTRLGIGSTGQVLTVAGGVPSWATVAGGGMTLLSTTALSGTATTVSSIDQTYTNLFIYIPTLTFSGNAELNFTTNSTTNYYLLRQQNGSFTYDNGITKIRTGSAGTTQYSGVVVNINRYSDSARHTGDLAYFDQNLGATGNTWFSINDAAAVTSITVTSQAGTATFSAGSVLIYGVK
jgi:hypothetical protein